MHSLCIREQLIKLSFLRSQLPGLHLFTMQNGLGPKNSTEKQNIVDGRNPAPPGMYKTM